jgi:hypothetical protein
LFDCCVVVVWDQVAWLLLAVWSQNCYVSTPSPAKIDDFVPYKHGVTMPSPGHLIPIAGAHKLIVDLVWSWVGHFSTLEWLSKLS